jgi:hypothetical protein
MSRLVSGIIALLLLAHLPACKVTKKSARKTVIVDSAALVRAQDSLKTVELNKEKEQLAANLTTLWARQIPFTTLNAKVKAHYEGGDQKHDFTANIHIQKDKAIWVNVTALGMVNVARILITQDSFKMINYLENKATVMSLKDAQGQLPVPVDFQVLQNMILGNVLKQSGTITDVTDFGGTWTLHTADDDYVQQYTYNKSDSTIRSAQIMSRKEANAHGVMQLGNYEIQSGRKFSTLRSLNMMAGGNIHTMDMNFTKVDFDGQVDFPFSIPKKFMLNGAVQADEVRPGQQKRIERRDDRKEDRHERKDERKENRQEKKANK